MKRRHRKKRRQWLGQRTAKNPKASHGHTRYIIIREHTSYLRTVWLWLYTSETSKKSWLAKKTRDAAKTLFYFM